MNAQQQAAYAAYHQYQAQAIQYAQAQQQSTVSGQQANQKYKSTLCNIWLMEGVCARGRMCHYAHGIRELNYSQYYNFWAQQSGTGTSPNAAATASATFRPELFRPEDYQNRFYKTALCQFWQQRGVCNNGDNCRWAHGEEELRKADQNGSGNGQQIEGATSDVMIGPQLDDGLIGPQLPQMADDGQISIGIVAEGKGGLPDEGENGGAAGRKRKWGEVENGDEGENATTEEGTT